MKQLTVLNKQSLRDEENSTELLTNTSFFQLYFLHFQNFVSVWALEHNDLYRIGHLILLSAYI